MDSYRVLNERIALACGLELRIALDRGPETGPEGLFPLPVSDEHVDIILEFWRGSTRIACHSMGDVFACEKFVLADGFCLADTDTDEIDDKAWEVLLRYDQTPPLCLQRPHAG